jgi:hypothetical protein
VPRRDWTAARAKVENEGRCRGCGQPIYEVETLEAAHLAGRKFDKVPPIWFPGTLHEWRSEPILVDPDRIVPLCGPATQTGACHCEFDGLGLDLIGKLTRAEETQVVADLGLYAAYRRLTRRART